MLNYIQNRIKANKIEITLVILILFFCVGLFYLVNHLGEELYFSSSYEYAKGLVSVYTYGIILYLLNIALLLMFSRILRGKIEGLHQLSWLLSFVFIIIFLYLTGTDLISVLNGEINFDSDDIFNQTRSKFEYFYIYPILISVFNIGLYAYIFKSSTEEKLIKKSNDNIENSILGLVELKKNNIITEEEFNSKLRDVFYNSFKTKKLNNSLIELSKKSLDNNLITLEKHNEIYNEELRKEVEKQISELKL